MQTLATAALVTMGILELGLVFWLAKSMRGQQRLEGRLDRLTEALSLLTETSESGFNANAAEIARLAQLPVEARRRVARARRTEPAAATGVNGSKTTDGRSAAPRQAPGAGLQKRMSEGEEHLRAHLKAKKSGKPVTRKINGRKVAATA